MNKTCEKLSVNLSAFFDGELDKDERLEVETHLLTCDACRDRLDRMLKIRYAMLDMVRPAGRRRSILDDLHARLDEQATTKEQSLLS